MSRDEDLRLGFMCGFLIAMAIYSLLQDTFGQERYLRLVAENWIPGWITVPLALVVVEIHEANPHTALLVAEVGAHVLGYDFTRELEILAGFLDVQTHDKWRSDRKG